MNKIEAQKHLDIIIDSINTEEKQDIFVSPDIFEKVGSFYRGFHIVKFFNPEYKKNYAMTKYHR